MTVPPSGAPRDLLWRRFAGVLGLDPDGFALEVGGNESLGLEQAELLRRVNLALGDRLPRPGPYRRIVRGILVGEVLAGRPGSRVGLSDTEAAVVREHAVLQVERLRRLDLDVVGDLEDLLVPAAVGPGRTGDSADVPVERLLAEALEVTVALLELLAAARGRHRERTARLRARIGRLEATYDAPASGSPTARSRVAGRVRRLLGRSGGRTRGVGS